MGLRKKTRKIANGASVVLATAGCSTCNDNGAVDPPPPPFQCTDAVHSGRTLHPTAWSDGLELHVTIVGDGDTEFASAAITDVEGGAARPPQVGRGLEIVIDLTDSRGSFLLTGALRGLVPGSATCAFTRRFQFVVDSGSGAVQISEADGLPLSERRPAAIALLFREGRDVELVAQVADELRAGYAWTVSGGQILSREGRRLHWRLPPEPGFYQVELVADYGPRGFSYETLVLEVV